LASNRVTYQWISGPTAPAKRFIRVDILLDNVQQSVQQSPNGAGTNGFGIGYSQYLWPKVGGVAQVPTPFILLGRSTNLNTAITQFNSTFGGVIQLVAHGSETNFNVDSIFNSGAYQRCL